MADEKLVTPLSPELPEEACEADPTKPEPLHAGDLWLQDIAAPWVTIDVEWLEEAKQLVDTGSTDLHENRGTSRQAVIGARYGFFEKLGWTDPRCEHHPVFQQIAEQKQTLMPLGTFIGTQRVLQKVHLDNSSLLIKHYALAYASPKHVGANIKLLAAVVDNELEFLNRHGRALTMNTSSLAMAVKEIRATGRNAKDTILQNGNVLTSPINRRKILDPAPLASAKQTNSRILTRESTDFDETRLATARQIARIVGWKGDVTKLSELSPLFGKASDARLLFHGWLFIRLSAAGQLQTSMRVDEVAALIALPPNVHLGVVILGKPYTIDGLESVQSTLASGSPYEDAKTIREALSDPTKLGAIVGTRVVRAYHWSRNPPRR